MTMTGMTRPVEDDRQAPSAGARAAECRAEVDRRIWERLREVQDPEIPVSVVGMGLIVSVAYDPAERRADLRITYTAMGCPAMDFIQDDIRDALLEDPDIDAVEIDVVWDPVWTKERIRAEARETMRELGIAV